MILINQNAKNEVAVTLKDRLCGCTGTTTYLFKFTNASTNQIAYVIGVDHSPSPCRYQLFCIIDIGQGIPDPTQSQVLFTLKGQYNYDVFANPDAVLDPTGLCFLESGKMLVVGPEPAQVAYQSDVNPDLVMYVNSDLNT